MRITEKCWWNGVKEGSRDGEVREQVETLSEGGQEEEEEK